MKFDSHKLGWENERRSFRHVVQSITWDMQQKEKNHQPKLSAYRPSPPRPAPRAQGCSFSIMFRASCFAHFPSRHIPDRVSDSPHVRQLYMPVHTQHNVPGFQIPANYIKKFGTKLGLDYLECESCGGKGGGRRDSGETFAQDVAIL